MQLPQRNKNRIAIKLKPAAERMVKKSHPWVYEGGIVKQSKEGVAGDLAIVFDSKKNKFLACGLYDPDSPIRIKMLQFHESVPIDKHWLEQKITAAYKKRQALLTTDTNSYRLLYGENDGLPSLIADRYKNVLVVKLYSEIWLPYLEDIVAILNQVTPAEAIILRLSRNMQNNAEKYGLYDGLVLAGLLEDEVIIFKEHGISFAANVIHGHKTGFFLDHRHNRKQIGDLSKGKKVLDVFAYAGGFSVHALAGGASEVVSIDISAKALEMAKQNAALNPHSGTHHCLAVDAFEGMEELYRNGERFDIVIIDPPSFAKKESEVAGALNSYKKLAEIGTRLVSKGGYLVLASCTARITAVQFFEAVEMVLKNSKYNFQLIEKTGHDIDHPIGFDQGAYLKCGYYLAQ